MRRAVSYPCPFKCTHTAETAEHLCMHIATHHLEAVLKLVGVLAFHGAKLWGDGTGERFIVTPKEPRTELEAHHEGDVFVKVK